MSFTIPSHHIKGEKGAALARYKDVQNSLFLTVFGRAIHCLGRIGEELFLEQQSDGVAIKTMNSAGSAMASFLFYREFFDDYAVKEGESKCKMTIRVSKGAC